MSQEYPRESKEQKVAELLRQLEDYFRGCVASGSDTSLETVILWNLAHGSNGPMIPQDLFSELHKVDKENLQANVNKILANIKAGSGLKIFLENWVLGRILDSSPRPKYPESN